MSGPIDKGCRGLACAVILRASEDARSLYQAHLFEQHAIAGQRNHEEARAFFAVGSPWLEFWCAVADKDLAAVGRWGRGLIAAAGLEAAARATRRSGISA